MFEISAARAALVEALTEANLSEPVSQLAQVDLMRDEAASLRDEIELHKANIAALQNQNTMLQTMVTNLQNGTT
jgi:hypothetical protein